MLSLHNTHLDGLEAFQDRDPQLRSLARQAVVYESPLLDDLPVEIPGVYTLGGARQIGKTTLLKQWMARLVARGTDPQRIFFLTGELLDDHHALVRAVEEHLRQMPHDGLSYLLIDEVTYVREWDRGVKFLADAGLLERTVLIVTGSDLTIVREARARFPGRRGVAAKVDFHLYPLSFSETLTLKGLLQADELAELASMTLAKLPGLSEEGWDRIYAALDDYLVHGGFLTAINDMVREGRILPATLRTYADWIRGDVLKRGKQEPYLREVLAAIVKRLGSQVSWNALARDLSIDHHQTVAQYVQLLAAMDAVIVQQALIEDKLVGAPKKARKLLFADPFILHAVRSWLQMVEDPYEDQILRLCRDAESAASMVEACVVSHAHRHFPAFYIKAAGEVDLALVSDGRFWPIEVKWTSQLRPKDLKQVRAYPNSVIAAQTRRRHAIDGVPVVPLPLILLRLAVGKWPLSDG